MMPTLIDKCLPRSPASDRDLVKALRPKSGSSKLFISVGHANQSGSNTLEGTKMKAWRVGKIHLPSQR